MTTWFILDFFGSVPFDKVSLSLSLSLSLSVCVCVCVCMQLCVTLLLCLQDGEEEGAPPHPAGPPPDTGHFIRENDLVVRLARSPTLVSLSLFLSFSLSVLCPLCPICPLPRLTPCFTVSLPLCLALRLQGTEEMSRDPSAALQGSVDWLSQSLQAVNASAPSLETQLRGHEDTYGDRLMEVDSLSLHLVCVCVSGCVCNGVCAIVCDCACLLCRS